MSAVSAIKDRVLATIPDFTGLVEEVADLSSLIESGNWPQRDRAVWVIPLGFNAREPEDATGAHLQMLDEIVGVVLYVQVSGDPKAKAALAKIDTMQDAVLQNVCGFVPAGAIDAVRAQRARLLSVTAGRVLYQIDLAIQMQLRITS